jgi:hypothetical protein
MEQVSQGIDELSPDSIPPDLMKTILRRWRRQAQEIMVHAFDFRYFYRDSGRYIEGIWHSWCAIAGIGDRVPEYVLRTLCAISSNLLKEPFDRCAETARLQLETALRRLIETRELMSNYAGEALTHIEKEWEVGDNRSSILQGYRARLYLVRLVNAFLYSETIAAQVFNDPHITRGASEGYRFKRNEFELAPIGSPLRFLSTYLGSSTDEAESLWVLHNLAFNSSYAEARS